VKQSGTISNGNPIPVWSQKFVQPKSSSPLTFHDSSESLQSSRSTKQPRLVFEGLSRSCAHPILAFPPNRDTLGGTAYLIVEKDGNILIDCPAWDDNHLECLRSHGGVRWLVITHRGGLGKVHDIQNAFNCEVVIQEQEAYLLPGLAVTTFQNDLTLTDHTRVIWTSGHSPGSACVYYSPCAVLFTGRHLIPDREGNPVPLRTAKTFHWNRQIRHVRQLLDEFNAETLQVICPGASTGFLRGKHAIDNAHEKLSQLDLDACLKTQPIL
jgi:glyoxylase-like metal-dependent hydrolase (beta-lactamase superfamily II)